VKVYIGSETDNDDAAPPQILSARCRVSSAATRALCAQTYPARPITVVVPYAAGGPGDTVARVISERVKAALGQPIVIENVTGANGSIAAGRVARAAPDGYTLSLGLWNTHVSNGAMYALGYDVLNDFEPVALLASFSSMIAVRKTCRPNPKELIAWLKVSQTTPLKGAPESAAWDMSRCLFCENHRDRKPARHIGLRSCDAGSTAGQIDMMIDASADPAELRAGQSFWRYCKDALAQASAFQQQMKRGCRALCVGWFGLGQRRRRKSSVDSRSGLSSLADPAAQKTLPILATRFRRRPADARGAQRVSKSETRSGG
jgi:hypothetical protein